MGWFQIIQVKICCRRVEGFWGCHKLLNAGVTQARVTVSPVVLPSKFIRVMLHVFCYRETQSGCGISKGLC